MPCYLLALNGFQLKYDGKAVKTESRCGGLAGWSEIIQHSGGGKGRKKQLINVIKKGFKTSPTHLTGS